MPEETAIARIRRLQQRNPAKFLVLLHPDRPPEDYSYREVITLAEGWRARLRAAGLGVGDAVAVILPHGIDLYAAYLGAILGGMIPSYFAPPSPKFSQQAYCASIDALVAASGARAAAIAADLAPLMAGRPALTDLRLLVPGEAAPADVGGDPTASADAVAFIQFSSGTTGLKKGVAISHRALLTQVDLYAAAIGLTEADRIATWLPLYHDMGLLTCWWTPLLTGTRLVAQSPFDWVKAPGSLLRAVAAYRASLCWLPNFAHQFIADRTPDAALTGLDLSSLRGVVNCSEPITDTARMAFMHKLRPYGLRPEALAASYAMAETVFAVTSAGFGVPATVVTLDDAALTRDGMVRPAQGDAPSRRVASSGRPLPGMVVTVTGPDGAPLPEDRLGDLTIAGPCLFDGYLNNPEATAASLNGGVYRTGDVGFIHQGEVYVLGRAADTIIIAGKNLYPQDLEAIVDAVPGVIPGRSVAFGLFDAAQGTERLVIMAESRAAAAEQAGLARAIHAAVAAATETAPSDVRLIAPGGLRKSTSGKLSRKENRRLYGEMIAAPADIAPSTTPMENDPRALVRAALLRALSGRTPAAVLAAIGDDDRLMDAGVIDSLGFVAVALEIEKAAGRPLPPQVIQRPLQFDSVALLADALAGRTAPTPPAAQAASSARQNLNARRNTLLPHLQDGERQPFEWTSYLMRRGAANYRSPSFNTDAIGFRAGWADGKPFHTGMFHAAPGPKALLLGNSCAFGVGVSHDSQCPANQLNARRRSGDPIWRNMALRAGGLTQERLAAELHAPDGVGHVAWLSGLNTLIAHLLGATDPTNPSPYIGEWVFRQMVGASFPPPSLRDPSATWPQMQRMLRRDLAILGAWRRAQGGRTLFLLQPALAWIDKVMTPEEQELVDIFDGAGQLVRLAHRPEHLRPWRERFAADVAAACAAAGIDFIDLNADPRFAAPEWLFVDRVHLTDRGHSLVADVIDAWRRSSVNEHLDKNSQH